MDKRIIILIAAFFTTSLAVFLYRKIFYHHEGIKYNINPPGLIYVGDNITYKDLTPDATRRKWSFGDDEYSTRQSGTHSFLAQGTFIVHLTTYGPFGILKKNADTVYVLPRPQVSSIPDTVVTAVVNNNVSNPPAPAKPTFIPPKQTNKGPKRPGINISDINKNGEHVKPGYEL